MKHDLVKFDKIFEDVLYYYDGKVRPSDLNDIKNELNRFYGGDSKCTEVLFTNNTDKAFFGMCVYPNITSYRVHTVLDSSYTGDHPGKGMYAIEFDSKLFDPLNGFTAQEITAILLHEVGHIAINEAKNATVINDFVNEYITKKDTTINFEDVHHASNLFKYSYIKTCQKMNSIFNKNQEEFQADRFTVDMGYGSHLESAFVKILKAKGNIKPNNKFTILLWSLTTYKQLFMRKKFIVKCMDDVIEYSGSRLEAEASKELKTKLVKDFNKAIKESVESLDRLDYIHEAFGKVKYAALKAIEDDAFVYAVRIKNVDNEIEAMDILRDLNGKINVVGDYLALEKSLNENDIRRWSLLLEKLRSLREQLSKADNYKPKYYSLFVQMPVTQRRF